MQLVRRWSVKANVVRLGLDSEPFAREHDVRLEVGVELKRPSHRHLNNICDAPLWLDCPREVEGPPVDMLTGTNVMRLTPPVVMGPVVVSHIYCKFRSAATGQQTHDAAAHQLQLEGRSERGWGGA
jgi:hypothetical protein